MLLSIQGGSDLGLFEINEAARLVQEAAHPEANIIFGTVIDDALGDEVRVTVIAAGFDGGGPMRRTDDRALGQVAGSTQRPNPAPSQPPRVGQPASQAKPSVHVGQIPAGVATPAVHPQTNGAQPAPVHPPEPVPVPVAVARPPRTVTFDDNDDLDVPDFLK